MRIFKDTTVTALAVATAFGMGVITTIYLEAKLLVEAWVVTEKKKARNSDTN